MTDLTRHGQPWTPADITVARDRSIPLAEAANRLGRSVEAVKDRRYQRRWSQDPSERQTALAIRRDANRAYREANRERISSRRRRQYASNPHLRTRQHAYDAERASWSNEHLAALQAESTTQATRRARVWTPDQDEQLRRSDMTAFELALSLNRTVHAVHKRRALLRSEEGPHVIRNPLSEDEIRALPPLVDIPTAARAMSIGRANAYALAAAGEFPIPVLRISARTLRVRSADLREFLGIREEEK